MKKPLTQERVKSLLHYDPEEARNAYLKGRLRYFGEYACR